MQNNARPHTASCTCDWLWDYSYKVMVDPPYTPSLTPSDFHLFGLHKKHLIVKQFAIYATVKQTVTAGYRQLTLISSAKILKPWCHNGTNA
jgi:hypothetical protein